ncbi:MAG TPA: DegQ family serine endoprotease [Alphaproteobacteria bacterium]|nr:DegQ family serine endoprotease [Alphaproteobacteria bacterium]
MSPRLSRFARAALAAPLALTLLAGTPALVSAPAQAAPTPETFSPLVKQVTPAVVNISTESAAPRAQQRGPQGQLPPGLPPQLEEFFRRFGEGGGDGPARRQPMRALGSGFIIDPAGYIVTNNHVAGEADEITVTLQDGTELPAKLVGRDERTDLALLKVESAKPLPYVAFGNSDVMEVGDWVLAVGNPFGLGGTVTAGIVSAKSRDINSGPYDDYIQTDAAINSGNSGGPMFNANGQVIGINTAIFSPTGGNIGIGFAVPANVARPVIEQLRATGTVTRGFLGVQIQPVTPEMASALGLGEARGALVAEVTPGSPAARAGLRQGDVIVGYQGQPVPSPRELTRSVAGTGIGTSAPLTFIRDGREQTVQVTVAKLEDEPQVAANDRAEPPGASGLGLSVATLDAETRARAGIEEDVNGVVVVGIGEESPAAQQGVRPGDVIQRVDGKPVASAKQMAEAVEEARRANKKAVALLLNREGNNRYVAVPLAGQG